MEQGDEQMGMADEAAVGGGLFGGAGAGHHHHPHQGGVGTALPGDADMMMTEDASASLWPGGFQGGGQYSNGGQELMI